MAKTKNNTERPASRNLKPLRSAFPFLAPYKAKLCLALFFLIVAAIAALGMPVALRAVIDYGFSGERTGSVDKYFIQLLLLAAVYAVFAAMRFYTVMWIGERVVADIRNKVYAHVVTLSPSFYETTRTGEVLSRLTTDTTLVQTVFGAGMSIALRSLVTLIGAFIMLFITSPKLTSMLLLLLPVVVMPVFLYGRKVRKLSRASQDKIADLSGLADETLNSIHIIQAYTLEKFQSNRFSQATERAFETATSRIRMSSLLSATIVLTAFSAIVCVLWIGAREVIGGSMTPGTLGQFVLYATFVAGSTMALGEVWSDVQRAAGAMERLLELLISRSNVSTPESPANFSVNEGRLDIKDVTFCYPSRQNNPSLKEFNLKINPGETIALVGPSGAGKSTVFQLLMRFYDAEAGNILFDGIDIKTADLTALRNRIGIVPQNTILFAASAMENIRLGRLDASDEEVMAAAKAAVADGFIRSLPEGYDTFLGEKGARLSGGQQQRIAIARAILKNPPMLLLDEATSSLDAESEKQVQEALEHLMQNRTTLVIAHRFATVKKVDRIIVMSDGSVVDEGTHDYLLKAGGLYAKLAELQFGGNDNSTEVTSAIP